MVEVVNGPCNCSGPHFHSVVHECCSRLAAVKKLHLKADGVCLECTDDEGQYAPWPCPTILVILDLGNELP